MIDSTELLLLTTRKSCHSEWLRPLSTYSVGAPVKVLLSCPELCCASFYFISIVIFKHLVTNTRWLPDFRKSLSHISRSISSLCSESCHVCTSLSSHNISTHNKRSLCHAAPIGRACVLQVDFSKATFDSPCTGSLRDDERYCDNSWSHIQYTAHDLQYTVNR